VTWFVAGAVLGLAGSLHCAGMCGPLLLVIHGRMAGSRVPRLGLYHASRILMYALLGIPAGYASRVLSFGVTGRTIAAIAGTLLIMAALGSAAGLYGHSIANAWSSAAVRLGGRAAMMARHHPWRSQVLLGAVNGVLPCGLVYAAVAGAAAAGTIRSAVVFMIGFGAGTLPLLGAITLSAVAVPAAARRRLRFVAPVLMALAGVLLVVRAVLPAAHGGHQHEVVAFGENGGSRR
jgi:uncharacterized protein